MCDLCVLLTSGAKGLMTWLVRGSASCRMRIIANCPQGMGVCFLLWGAWCSSGSRGVSSSAWSSRAVMTRETGRKEGGKDGEKEEGIEGQGETLSMLWAGQGAL